MEKNSKISFNAGDAPPESGAFDESALKGDAS
jgi:hypothetical protein